MMARTPERAGSDDVPEPDLLTHDELGGRRRTDDFGYDDPEWLDEDQRRFNEFAPDDSDSETDADNGGGAPGATTSRTSKAPPSANQRRKRRWRRVRRTLYALVGVFVVLPALAFTIAYFLVDVPTPEEVAADQNKIVTYYYADGSELGKEVPAHGNRQPLDSEEIPQVMKHAAYAAEDASFESNSGFDVGGIFRAAWNQISGGSGGGSTISQQYVKKATENEEHTITRKALEVVKSFKMNNEQSKEDIITAYLNTIYFGRGASGIQTASQAYFNKDAKDINPSEAAYLAGLIQAPSRSDDTAYATQRWNYVMDQMVAGGWLPEQERATAQFPEPVPAEQTRPESITGPASLIQNRIKQELAAKGYPEEKVHSGGYKVYTTIDPRAQQLAEQTVNDVMRGEPEDLKEALVAVDPKSGGVKAYYGGPASQEDAVDWANTPREPGSSFKPFDLVALLQQGKGLGETYDGSSPRHFGGATVRNSNGMQCPGCSVSEAMKKSVNTVFYDMVANDTGVDAVAKAARAAGIPEAHGDRKTMPNPDNNIAIGGGSTQVTTEDMAAAYATFANNGMRSKQHFVAKVTTPDDETVLEQDHNATPAFDPDENKSKQIAGNVTRSLEPVLGYSDLSCSGNRDCAGKTGTHQYVDPSGEDTDENSQAWMIGYTPSISTASWVGSGGNDKIRSASGKRIYGKDLPGEMWQQFMNAYLKGSKPEKFPKVDLIGKPVRKSSPTTTQTRTRTSVNTSKPTQTQEPTSSRPEPTTAPEPTESLAPSAPEPTEVPSSEPPGDEPSPNPEPELPDGDQVPEGRNESAPDG